MATSIKGTDLIRPECNQNCTLEPSVSQSHFPCSRQCSCSTPLASHRAEIMHLWKSKQVQCLSVGSLCSWIRTKMQCAKGGEELKELKVFISLYLRVITVGK
jgi:hypothetical protein